VAPEEARFIACRMMIKKCIHTMHLG
jgi:hypothetical protein